jgi:hypothetical protein
MMRVLLYATTLCLTLLCMPAQAQLKTTVVPGIPYDWIEEDFFSFDEEKATDLIEVRIKDSSPHRNKSSLISFIDAINDPLNQQKLKEAYNLNNRTYLILARLAVGIMYAESRLGTHPRYLFKDRFPWTVTLAKRFLEGSKLDTQNYKRAIEDGTLGLAIEYLALNDKDADAREISALMIDLSENSRGPTQIKFLPEGFEQIFSHINKDNLHVPQYSAVATLAYLADAIRTLKRLGTKYNCMIPREYFLHHLLYVYIGRGSEIVNCTATLDQNLYWGRSVSVQNHIDAYLKSAPKPELNYFTKKRIEQIKEEIAYREIRKKIFSELILTLEAYRDEDLVIKPENANRMMEYLVAAGLVTISNHALHKGIKKYFSPPNPKAKLCDRIIRKLAGRKRHYVLLNGVNAAVIYKVLSDPKLGLDQFFAMDQDKLKQMELEALISEDTLIIKRLELDIAILETGL